MQTIVSNELLIVNDAVALLRSLGAASAQYITAEFQPFSNQFKPDLRFTPAFGRNTGQLFFIEYRILQNGPCTSFVNHLVEHRDFVVNALDLASVHYGFALNQTLREADARFLTRNRIKLIPNITNGHELFRHIFYWCKIPLMLINKSYISNPADALTAHII